MRATHSIPAPSKLKPRHLALVAALAATLMLAGCNRGADEAVAPAPMASDQPLATAPSQVTVRDVTLGSTVGLDHRITIPATTFASSDPIAVSIDTTGTATDAEITARLVYQDGQTAGEQSQKISSLGSEVTSIAFINANGWPAGSYRAEIWVDGTQVDSRELTVR